jgi:hypothetical protein
MSASFCEVFSLLLRFRFLFRPHFPEPRSPGIDFKESIPLAYVVWQANMTNRVIVPARQAAQAGGIDSWAP